MKISFAEFVKGLDLPYKIPEHIKSFIKDMENNKRYCICLHRHAGRRTIESLYDKYKSYLKGENSDEIPTTGKSNSKILL